MPRALCPERLATIRAIADRQHDPETRAAFDDLLKGLTPDCADLFNESELRDRIGSDPLVAGIYCMWMRSVVGADLEPGDYERLVTVIEDDLTRHVSVVLAAARRLRAPVAA